MKVRYIAPFGCRTGYAQAAQDYISALVACGVEVEIVPLNEGSLDTLDGRYHHLLPNVVSDLEDVTHHVVHTVPGYAHLFATGDYAPEEGVKRVCVTTWETDKLPQQFVDSLTKAFDLIVVPSRFNRNVFVSSGIPSAKVAVVPHTYDPKFWQRPDDARWTAGWVPPRPMVFYGISVWGSRKNLVGTLLAYWHAFSDPTYNVVFKVLCPQPPDGEIENLIQRCALDHFAPVEFITKQLSEDELRQLHHESHCYIAATRGEAWGLGAFEAAATGNLVIMTGYGGQMDFLTRANRAIVPHQMTPVAPETYGSGTLNVAGMRLRGVSRAAPTGFSADQCWAEPDLVAMALAMRRAYDGPPTHQGPPDMTPFTYETVGPQLRKTLEEA